MVNALFKNDIDTYEFIRKVSGSPFTDEEKAALLQAEGGTWTKSEARSDGKLESWTRDDGATATYDTETPSMLLMSNKNYPTNASGVATAPNLFEIISVGGIVIIALLGCCLVIAIFWKMGKETEGKGS